MTLRLFLLPVVRAALSRSQTAISCSNQRLAPNRLLWGGKSIENLGRRRCNRWLHSLLGVDYCCAFNCGEGSNHLCLQKWSPSCKQPRREPTPPLRAPSQSKPKPYAGVSPADRQPGITLQGLVGHQRPGDGEAGCRAVGHDDRDGAVEFDHGRGRDRHALGAERSDSARVARVWQAAICACWR